MMERKRLIFQPRRAPPWASPLPGNGRYHRHGGKQQYYGQFADITNTINRNHHTQPMGQVFLQNKGSNNPISHCHKCGFHTRTCDGNLSRFIYSFIIYDKNTDSSNNITQNSYVLKHRSNHKPRRYSPPKGWDITEAHAPFNAFTHSTTWQKSKQRRVVNMSPPRIPEIATARLRDHNTVTRHR